MRSFFLAVIFTFNGLIYAQNHSGVINYKVVSKYDQEIKDEEIKDFMKKTEAELIKLEFELIFNSKESLFREKQSLEIEDDAYFRDMALAMAGSSNRVWYTDSQQMLMQYNFMNQLFLIESKKDYIEWELSKETKKIGDYLCYKATCSLKNVGSKGLGQKKVEVWYTNEIPVQLGPVGLVGLPGLILEANFFKVSYVVSNIDIKKNQSLTIVKPDKGTYMIENDFYEMAVAKVKEVRDNRQ